MALPLIIPIYAWVYIVENPTAGVTKLLTFLPFTAPIVVLQRLGPGAIEPWEVAVSLVILALTVAGSLMLVGRGLPRLPAELRQAARPPSALAGARARLGLSADNLLSTASRSSVVVIA